MRRREFVRLAALATIGWPHFASAQQPAMPVIGYLSGGSLESDGSRTPAFRQGLKEAGYLEGANVAIEFRWALGDGRRLPAMAADLVRRQVAVIATVGAPPAVAAKAATKTIPIVFVVGDPIEFGLVASLSHPGGNLTGVAHMIGELAGKRLQLLHEAVPEVAAVAVLVNPTNPAASDSQIRSLQDAAGLLGLRLHILQASTASDIDGAFATITRVGAGALVVGSDPFLTNAKDQIVTLAAHHAVPAIYVWREFVAAGGLMSYGADLADSYRQAGVFTAKILKGARPADLPVEQSVKLPFVLDLRTAKALGLAIPGSLLARADEVIE